MTDYVIKSDEEAKAVANAITTGQLQLDQQEGLVRALRQWKDERVEVAANQQAAASEGTPQPITTVIDRTVDPETGEPEKPRFTDDFLRQTGGMLDMMAAMGTSAIAEPAAGAGAMLQQGLPMLWPWSNSFFSPSKWNNDQATATVAAISDGLTWQPKTKAGQDYMQSVMTPLAKIEEGADWIASNASFGNPLAATAIKTGLLGGMEMLGMKGAGRVRIPRKVQKIMDDAEALGINLDPAHFQSSVLEAAERMSPDQRAANAGFLQEAMRVAKEQQATAVDAAFAEARAGRAHMQADQFMDFADGLAKDLQSRGYRFDAEGMADIGTRIAELRQLGMVRNYRGDVPVTILDSKGFGMEAPSNVLRNFDELEMIRRQLVQDARSGTPTKRSAANAMKHQIDDWIDHQLANDMIKGDPGTIAAWKKARAKHSEYFENFSEDRAIKNMIEKDATPEQVRAWLTGLNAIGMRANAAVSIRKIKSVLGENHPAIEGIRQDLLFEVAEPLLRSQPNWSGFLNNYKRHIDKNPSMVAELDLNNSQLAKLKQFAETARSMGPNNALFDKSLFTRALATFFVGHGLARKALAVSFTRKVGHIILNVNRTTKRGIIADITNATYGKPILPRRGASAAVFIAASALSEAEEYRDKQNQRLKDAEDERKRRVAGQNLTF